MKCYNCGKEVSTYDQHCGHCGALLKMTNKLFTAIQAGNQEAVIQLYKMVYNQVYNHFLELGIIKVEIPKLIHQAYQDFLTHSREITTIEAFEPFFTGICDNVAFTYLKNHHQEPHELEREIFVKPSQEDIDEIVKMVKGSSKSSVIKNEKKTHKGIIIAVVIALLVVCIGGYFGFGMIQKKSVEKKQTKNYLKVNDQYVAAVRTLAVDSSKKSYKQVTKKYPLVAKQAYMTYHKNPTNQAVKNLSYKFYDLSGKGSKELLIGYKNDSRLIILGVYTNNGSKTISLAPVKGVAHEWKYVLTNDHRMLRGYKNSDGDYVYTLFKVKNQKTVTEKSSIHHLSSYLKKNHLKTISVSAKSIRGTKTKSEEIITDQDRWLSYVKNKQFSKADALGKTMSNNVEDPGVKYMSKDMKDAYLAKVKDYQETYDGVTQDEIGAVLYTLGYLLTDMDGDGQVELIIEWGTGANNGDNLAFFSYKNGRLMTLDEEFPVSNCALLYYPNHAGMIRDYGHTGSQQINIIHVVDDEVKWGWTAEFTIDEYITSGLQLTRHVAKENYFSNSELDFSVLS